jgi:hypothetical protein
MHDYGVAVVVERESVSEHAAANVVVWPAGAQQESGVWALVHEVDAPEDAQPVDDPPVLGKIVIETPQ